MNRIREFLKIPSVNTASIDPRALQIIPSGSFHAKLDLTIARLIPASTFYRIVEGDFAIFVPDMRENSILWNEIASLVTGQKPAFY
jgi:hypothetical protein